MTTRFLAKFLAFVVAALTVRAAGAALQDPEPAVNPGADSAPATPPAPPPAEPTPPPAEPTPPPAAIPAPIAPSPAPTALVLPPVALAEPLAGFSDQTAFLRSPDNQFILFPNGRLQNDVYVFRSDNKVPNNSFLIRRARVELNGWVGPWFFFHLAGDFAVGAPAPADPIAQSNLATTDDFVAVAPWGDLAIFQLGQYDAPFTLENRTSDKYFDFMERSITVRAFGIPSNKEMGAMIHGILPDRVAYYSLGVFNGDGQNYRNVDNEFDVMGRGWVAPLAFGGPEILRSITLGGSFWLGKRVNALPLATQTTQGGFAFFTPKWNNAASAMGAVPASTYELHQDRDLQEFAFEVNAPVAHKYGARWELVWKRQQPFTVDDVTGGKAPTPLGDGGKEDGYATYGELWAWVIGDDRIIGDPGLQLPARFKKFGVKPPQQGVMVVARLEYLSETVTAYPITSTLAGISNVTGTTKVTSFQLGVNYWYSKRFRGTFNYVFNDFGGNNVNVAKLKSENEFLFRLAIAL
jgi:Phosphate-selective porin O and P